jgi:hypothetical protein
MSNKRSFVRNEAHANASVLIFKYVIEQSIINDYDYM